MEATAIHEKLQAELGEAILEYVDGPEKGTIVSAEKILETATLMRDDPDLAFDQLMCLSGLDWDGYDEAGKGKSVAILGYDDLGKPETSDRVAEGDLGVAYALYSFKHGHRYTLFTRVPREGVEVPSVAGVWPTASWHEREAWDMVGVRFGGHPDLRRMLLEEDWDGHPLRKDYVMPDRYGEVPMTGQDYAENPFSEDDVVRPERAPGSEG